MYFLKQLITQQMFEAAVKILQDEDTCVVSAGNIRLT